MVMKLKASAKQNPENSMQKELRPVGRPSRYQTKIITIKSADTLDAMKKGDMALAIEKSIRVALPSLNVVVQTKQRMDKEGIPYDFNCVLDIIQINSNPIKFGWELRHYMTNFLLTTKGKEDFRFPLTLPKDIPPTE